MPRSGRRSHGRNGPNHLSPADITLNDFANCKVAGGRLKKPAINSFSRTVKLASTLGESEDEGEFVEENIETAEQGFKALNLTKAKKCSSKEMSNEETRFGGVDYPLDLWFLLGDYVKPEDIQIFASICKRSLYVVRTYKFWICLYKRYYSPSISLPDRLQPIEIQRPHLIKFNVVRALNYLYPLFVKRRTNANRQVNAENEAHALVQLKCVSAWHANSGQNSAKWTFFFKFQKSELVAANNGSPLAAATEGATNNGHGQGKLLNRRNPDNWEEENSDNELQHSYYYHNSRIDVNGTPEEGCHVLALSCNHFSAIPPSVLGRRLADVRFSLCGDMRGHRIRLYFVSNSYQCKSPAKKNNYPQQRIKNSGDDIQVVDFNPVETIQVIRWWHPQYPQLLA